MIVFVCNDRTVCVFSFCFRFSRGTATNDLRLLATARCQASRGTRETLSGNPWRQVSAGRIWHVLSITATMMVDMALRRKKKKKCSVLRLNSTALCVEYYQFVSFGGIGECLRYHQGV